MYMTEFEMAPLLTQAL